MWKIAIVHIRLGEQEPTGFSLHEFNTEAAARTVMQFLEAHHYGQFILFKDPGVFVMAENGQPRRL